MFPETDREVFDAATITLNPAIDQTIIISEFKSGTVNRVEQEWKSAGGKGVNVASALSATGFQVAATGFLGCENSAIFEDHFRQFKIADCFLRVEGFTRTSIKICDPAQGITTDINFPGNKLTDENLVLFREQLARIKASWFVLSGSLPAGSDSATYRDLIHWLKQRGQKVALDTSGEALKNAISARPDVIKPNLAELQELAGRELNSVGEIIAFARELVAGGIPLVVTSMGKAGALFVTGSQAVKATPPGLDPVSTVGAGDALVAGLVAGQLRKYSLEESAQLACAYSAAALSGAKALSNLEIELLLASIKVELV